MAKELVMKAATVEEAQAKLVEALGVPAASIRFETLTAPQKKTLGLFGGADAEVKGTVVDGAAEAAKAFLEDVLTEMGAADFTVTVNETKDTCLMVVEGEDLGFIIGRRGETLDALQYLVGLVANRIDKDYCRINIDIGNYREKRENTLRSLARKNAAKVRKYGRNVVLEPMNPYERRIIHTTVQEIEGVTSHSVGSDSERKVVITLEEGVKPTNGGGYSRGRGGYNKGGRGGYRGGNRGGYNRSESSDAPSAPARAPRSDSAGSLYGKIEINKD